MLSTSFFDADAATVAKQLLGKVVRVKNGELWLSAKIIETEAYYLNDKASHASLGFTPKRQALFMPAGTIYMYYARGGDSLNVSCQGEGNAVLIKSALAYQDAQSLQASVDKMQQLNPLPGPRARDVNKLCSGQTLLCKSLGLKVVDWDQQQFDSARFYIEDVGYQPKHIIQAARLGIPKGRDENLPFRFIDQQYLRSTTKPSSV